MRKESDLSKESRDQPGPRGPGIGPGIEPGLISGPSAAGLWDIDEVSAYLRIP